MRMPAYQTDQPFHSTIWPFILLATLFLSGFAGWFNGTLSQYDRLSPSDIPPARFFSCSDRSLTRGGFSPLEVIVQESGCAGISAELPLRVAYRESRFDPLAVSKTADFGLFQLHSSTIRTLHVADPFDPRQSAIGGVGLLANYLAVCKSERGAVKMYATWVGGCGK